MLPLESLGTVFNSSSIVTIQHWNSKSCIISETKRDIGRKSHDFFIPTCIRRPVRGFSSEYCHTISCGKARMVWLPDGEKKSEDMSSRFNRIPACDRQTDGRTDTSCDGIVRDMHNRRAVKYNQREIRCTA